MPRPRFSGRSPPSGRATKARSRWRRCLTHNVLPRSGTTPSRKRLPIRVFLWMNSIALSVPPKTTPRFAKSSFSVFRIPAIRVDKMSSKNRMTEVQQIAQTLGIIVGAASCCEEVTGERVNAVAVKLRELVAATADDETDGDLANEQFSAGLEAGKACGRERDAQDRPQTGRRRPERSGTATLGLEPRARRDSAAASRSFWRSIKNYP